MGSTIMVVFRHFFLRLIWVALMTSFGIHLLLTILPAKKLVDPRATLGEESVSMRKWGGEHYLDWIQSVASFDMQITDQGTGQWEVNQFALQVNNSLTLCLVAFLIASLLGVVVGAYRASLDYELLSGPKTGMAHQTSQYSKWTLFILSSMPSYIIAYILFLWLESESGMGLAILALALGSGTAMDVARMTQNSHSRQLRSKYIESAIANGLKTRGLLPMPGYVAWHAFRNSLITVLPVTALRLPLIVSSAMMVEVVFDIPGMGVALLNALIHQDIPYVLSIILVSVIFVQICLFLAEFMAFLLHPKAVLD